MQKTVKIFGVLYFLLILLFNASAQEEIDQQIKEAETYYAEGKYQQAVQVYENLLKSTGKESFGVYFNLGNAYFKSNDIPAAILNYERARKIKPQDEDLLFNLEIANQQVVDQFDAVPELGIDQWYRSFLFGLSSNTWAFLSAVFFSLMLFFFGLFLYKSEVNIKRSSLLGGVLLLIFSALTFMFASQQKEYIVDNIEAVVFAPNVTATSAPNQKSTSLFVLHEGTKVQVIEEKENWVRIKISDGNIGWLEANKVEMI
ncbi:tetratricopeptide repeat protein [Chondrinema litorale]|uniref:tetratricopeptide repeat protein n=1 Tax=Chondrinema litorale TaxID=2994555 RepID=UPI002542ABB9|nr:tetratricopeptide repeat protein [Chondrinema litorale]UZR92828.1 tetratricopeptide repeat protein [Chondrinema litorale]